MTEKDKKVMKAMEICNRILRNLIEERKTSEEDFNRLKELAMDTTISVSNSELNFQEEIISYLKVLGIPSNLKGYKYILFAVQLGLSDTSYMENLTQKLYPDIANKFGTSPQKVERSIRHAIEKSWSVTSQNRKREIFGEAYCFDAKPTNGHFLSTLVTEIKLFG